MHAKLLLFTESKPSDEKIAEIMNPHCEEIDGEYNEKGFWDWYVVGGRCQGCLTPKNTDNVIIGRKSWINENAQTEGVDGCFLKDLANRNGLETYSYLLENGTYNARSIWDGSAWEKNENFDNELQEILKNKELFVTVIDCHN